MNDGNLSQIPETVIVYRDRFRGELRDDSMFATYRAEDGLVFHVVPRSQAESPDGIMRSLSDTARRVRSPSPRFTPYGIVIELRLGDRHQRQRFTLAHELGHLCFVNDRPSYDRDGSAHGWERRASQIEERLCDRIASELLMPATTFAKRAGAAWGAPNRRPTYGDLEALARIFDVSPTAAHRRLRELRLWAGRIPALPGRQQRDDRWRDTASAPPF